MKTYRAGRAVQISGGQVQLTDEQARRRAGQVRSTKQKGVYEVVGSIQFKAGEVFGFDGDVPKSSAEDLVEASAEDRKAAQEREKQSVAARTGKEPKAEAPKPAPTAPAPAPTAPAPTAPAPAPAGGQK